MNKKNVCKIASAALAGTLLVAGGAFFAANQFQDGAKTVVADKNASIITESVTGLETPKPVVAQKTSKKEKMQLPFIISGKVLSHIFIIM